MLKDYHLDGKRNRRVDHLIHTLVNEMLPTYEDHHKRQKLGMQGPNLAEKRWKDILARAPETPLERIKEIAESRFEVQSTSSEKLYEVNLLTYTCTCLNFPHIKLCKHVAAVVHFFGGDLKVAELGPPAPVNASASELEPDVPKSPAQEDDSAANSKTRASLNSVVNNIFRLAHSILETALADPDPDMVKSLKMARSQLNAVQCNMNDNSSRLPEKEQIAPNQLSWPPTATRMGVKREEKRRGKVDSVLTAEHIGVHKWKRTNDDPYGTGEDFGKRAKPDAVLAAANARARAATERKAAAERLPPECPPASLPTRLPLGSASFAPPHPMHTPTVYSHFLLLPHSQPAPNLQPYAFHYPVSQPYSPMFSTYSFPSPSA